MIYVMIGVRRMRYRIVTVDHKREKINPWHDKVRGRECDIWYLEKYEPALLLVDMGYDPSCSKTIKYRTSPVVSAKKYNEMLLIETMNTVYGLEDLEYGTK